MGNDQMESRKTSKNPGDEKHKGKIQGGRQKIQTVQCRNSIDGITSQKNTSPKEYIEKRT